MHKLIQYMTKWRQIHFFIFWISLISSLLIGAISWNSELSLSQSKQNETKAVVESSKGIIFSKIASYDFESVATVCNALLLTPEVLEIQVRIWRAKQDDNTIVICDAHKKDRLIPGNNKIQYTKKNNSSGTTTQITVSVQQPSRSQFFYSAAMTTISAFLFLFCLLLGFSFLFASRFIIPQLQNILTLMGQTKTNGVREQNSHLSHAFLGEFASQFNDMQLSLEVERAERNRAEQELRESEYRLRTTLNSIGDGVIATNVNGQIILMNRVAETITGYALDEALNQQVDTILNSHASSRSRGMSELGQNNLSSALKQKEQHNWSVKTPDNNNIIVSEVSSPILSFKNEVVGKVVVLRDITREQELQEHLLQSEKMRAIGQLASGIAHDFNNMLAGISSSAEILKIRGADQLDEKSFKCVSIIEKSAFKAANLVEKLLLFGRKQEIGVKNVANIGAVINDTVQILSQTINRNISVNVQNLIAVQSEHVQFNPTDLESVLLNLCLNAIQAMSGEGRLTICLEKNGQPKTDDKIFLALPTSEWIALSVEDTGLGIGKEHLNHIFEPFYSTKTDIGGTGLGLASVYSTVQSFNGGITLWSQVNKGTRFTLYLPLELSINETDEHFGNDTELNDLTILLIDDEESLRLTVSLMLEEFGCNVIQATNGRTGVNLYQASPEKFDWVILDLNMPDLNGVETAKELFLINPECKIIIVSGFLGAEMLLGFDTSKFKGMLQKPVNFSELRKLLEVSSHNIKH